MSFKIQVATIVLAAHFAACAMPEGAGSDTTATKPGEPAAPVDPAQQQQQPQQTVAAPVDPNVQTAVAREDYKIVEELAVRLDAEGQDGAAFAAAYKEANPETAPGASLVEEDKVAAYGKVTGFAALYAENGVTFTLVVKFTLEIAVIRAPDRLAEAKQAAVDGGAVLIKDNPHFDTAAFIEVVGALSLVAVTVKQENDGAFADADAVGKYYLSFTAQIDLAGLEKKGVGIGIVAGPIIANLNGILPEDGMKVLVREEMKREVQDDNDDARKLRHDEKQRQFAEFAGAFAKENGEDPAKFMGPIISAIDELKNTGFKTEVNYTSLASGYSAIGGATLKFEDVLRGIPAKDRPADFKPEDAIKGVADKCALYHMAEQEKIVEATLLLADATFVGDAMKPDGAAAAGAGTPATTTPPGGDFDFCKLDAFVPPADKPKPHFENEAQCVAELTKVKPMADAQKMCHEMFKPKDDDAGTNTTTTTNTNTNTNTTVTSQLETCEMETEFILATRSDVEGKFTFHCASREDLTNDALVGEFCHYEASPFLVVFSGADGSFPAGQCVDKEYLALHTNGVLTIAPVAHEFNATLTPN